MMKNRTFAEVRAETKKERKVLGVLNIDAEGRSYEKQIQALAAAKVCTLFEVLPSQMVSVSGVSEMTISKYMRKLARMDASAGVLSVITKSGRPRVYSEAVDSAFIVWLLNPERVYSEKMMSVMLQNIYQSSHTRSGTNRSRFKKAY